MSRIKLKNFGPVKEGITDGEGWLDVKKVTVFIGNQGSGKSTVAKLISTLSWLEKAMVRGISAHEDVNTFKRFQRMLRYQRIDNYLGKDSEIEFIGEALHFTFKENRLSSNWTLKTHYDLPKIMYVPAERNFLAVVDKPDKLKNLPLTLFTFLDEYDGARNLYSSGIEIPVGNIRFEYDKQNKLAHITDKEVSYKLRLSEAASGFQSTVPLYLVTKYLSESLGREKDAGIKDLSLEEQRKQDKIRSRIKNDRKLNVEQREMRYKLLEALPSAFINIVEEPEQNLFPGSQQKLLHYLLEYNSKHAGNKLIMTTHSPYLINYITLAVKGEMVKSVIKKEEARKKLNEIVPLHSTIKPEDLAIYQMDENEGTVKKLADYKGLPSDENLLNFDLEYSNELFAQLQEIEKGWQ
jgi:ABC-type multidrug transport system ATPase subunit